MGTLARDIFIVASILYGLCGSSAEATSIADGRSVGDALAWAINKYYSETQDLPGSLKELEGFLHDQEGSGFSEYVPSAFAWTIGEVRKPIPMVGDDCVVMAAENPGEKKKLRDSEYSWIVVFSVESDRAFAASVRTGEVKQWIASKVMEVQERGSANQPNGLDSAAGDELVVESAQGGERSSWLLFSILAVWVVGLVVIFLRR